MPFSLTLEFILTRMHPSSRYVISCLLAFLLLGTFNGRAANIPLANSNIQTGLQSLALETTNGLANADAAFAAALSNNPTSDNALVLKSATGLALLQQSTNFVQLLSAIGVTQPNQSLYSYDYQFPVDYNGHLILSGNSTNIGNYIDNSLRPQLATSITNLSAVSTNISLRLTASQTSTVPMVIDYGDVQWALCMLYLVKSASYAIDGYNTTIALPDFARFLSGATTAQGILNAYPSLLNLSSSPSSRTLAAQAFTNAYSCYQQSTNFIFTRRSVVPGYTNFFVLDTNDPIVTASISSTGARFQALSASLTSVQTFPSDTNNPTPLDGKTVSLAPWASIPSSSASS